MSVRPIAAVAARIGAPALVLALSVAAPSAAAASAPTCPPAVGGLTLTQHDVAPGKTETVLQCEYELRTPTGGTSVSMTVGWQDRAGDTAFVGAAPCSGQQTIQRDDANATLSVASGTHHVGSYASGETFSDGRGRAAPVPAAFTPVMSALVTQAESVAFECGSHEATGTGAAPGGTRSDSTPTEAEMLIAAGLIMTLLAGAGPELLRGILRLLPMKAGPVAPGLIEAAVGDADLGFHRIDDLPAQTWWSAGPSENAPPDAPAPSVDRTLSRGAGSDGGSVPNATPAQIAALQSEFASTVQQRLDEGYWVRNPDLLSKVWNSVAHPFWGSHSGQCGEFAANGVRWMSDYVHDTFGPGAIVDEVYVARRSVFEPNPDVLDQLDAQLPVNHAATRVILPDGRRYVMDFWDAMGASQGRPPSLVPEDEWAARWSARIPSGRISRSAIEQQLRDSVLTMGDDKGMRAFRAENKKSHTSAEAETVINSWRLDPW